MITWPIAGADPGFPGQGRQPIILQNVCQKLHEIKKKLAPPWIRHCSLLDAYYRPQ